ncbi:CRISPR-associated endonuclease Cas9 [Echinicola pacifica]|uniref:CRISPR-associated endonuclease Cas9 n=1 Tax=Echinicola pacifica TaxID=346377 RepID=A0A918Q1A5_9BACT|nr:type II CRISPR RNA-guided endonuclease Cas9 [Echinicola pacifica]GGZ30395.1 CRISPR-associated endonuclease Cas9 [Echinicola pacifica]
MKRILGLDLGTTSIGWAYIKEAESEKEKSSIEKIGVRVNTLSSDEKTNFEKGKPITTNANRTLKRSARRNLDRYQLRRNNLIEVLIRERIITNESILAESGKNTTFETWKLRSTAVSERINKNQLARVLLAINKKRGYKSSRKAKNEEEGHSIDGMVIAKKLYDENLHPGQLVFRLLNEGIKNLPEFYRSDLQAEFDCIWDTQKKYHPEVFTDNFYREIMGKGQKATSAAFWRNFGFNTADIKDIHEKLKSPKTISFGLREKKKYQGYYWRNIGIHSKLEKEEAAYVITDINNELKKSSGYLGAISDRSKELYFNKVTIGQYLYNTLKQDKNSKLKNTVFYRQDYFDEFELIWETQAKYHPELTRKLKEEIRDIIIFYQRKLKSQKGLISLCEFENREISVKKGGKISTRTIGSKVIPRSSPLFQEFKILQLLHNIKIRKKGSKKRSVAKEKILTEESDIFILDSLAREHLYSELNIKGTLKATEIIKHLGYKTTEWEVANYTQIEGNNTNKLFYEAYLKIIESEGYDIIEIFGGKADSDEVKLSDFTISASDLKDKILTIFESLKINSQILEFNAELEGKAFEKQASYQLWHLLYSAEDDSNNHSADDIHTFGKDNIDLKKLLCNKYGFQPHHAKILTNLPLDREYGSLSSKAIRKIYPFIKEHQYSEACEYAGYRHSKSSLTKSEVQNRSLKNKLDLLKKNSLRNPVVEKILNQMINVVNSLIDQENVLLVKQGLPPEFHFDEIRIELARELKKNAKEREEMTTNIAHAKNLHDSIFSTLQDEFGIKNPTRNDILRYKLYEELKSTGFKDLYTNVYIPRDKIFTKEIDIEHIIPQSKVFDDSFSNKTLTFRKINNDKGNLTAYDYILGEFGQIALDSYLERIKVLFDLGQKNNKEGISKAKYQKLLKTNSQIGEGFIERDLRDSQYIAKQAKSILFEITRSVVATSGNITDRLRRDWNLINVMQELNFSKYNHIGLTEVIENKDGTFKERIVGWNKRNDHRHHALDALTIAFTKHSHIQYLNHLNARKDETHIKHILINQIENKETHKVLSKNGRKKTQFNVPIPNFRQAAKAHLESVLVSRKAKNKVVTRNKNLIKTVKEVLIKTELTPRGQLHNESIYKKYKYPITKEVKIGGRFDEELISMVNNPHYKKLLLLRLYEFGNDPKKAFTGKNALAKNPIFINPDKTEKLPEKISITQFLEGYSIRNKIDHLLNIDKVIDEGVKQILMERLERFNNDRKKAFSNLEKDPIWLNKAKGISIKNVRIRGKKNAESLHSKKDHLGNKILDQNGFEIPVDFVNTGSNHHVAIYIDKEGNLQENIVSFFEAVARANQKLEIIDKNYNKDLGWTFLFSLKQNEHFVFPDLGNGFNPSDFDLFSKDNKSVISPHLFRVQKLATKDYFFRHHLDTSVEENAKLKGITWKRTGLTGLKGIVKVRINHLGDVVSIGETR